MMKKITATSKVLLLVHAERMATMLQTPARGARRADTTGRGYIWTLG